MPSKSLILTVGSMTLDLFVKPKNTTIMRFACEGKDNEKYMALPYGSKVTVEEVYEKYGGGGHNTAVGIARLGISTRPLATIGKDSWGERILENLAREKIDSTGLQYSSAHKTGFSVILSSFEGERTVLYHAGANQDCGDFDPSILEECDGLFFNHISATGPGAETVFQKIKRHFLAHPKKFLAWNPGKEQLSQGALAFADFFPVVDILLLNREEAELFTGRVSEVSLQEKYAIQKGVHFCPKEGKNFPHYAADYTDIFRVFIRQGVRNVVITDGQRGAQLCDGRRIYFCGIDDNALRVDTLGAGDAFGSGLFYALFHKKPVPFALRCATVNAASVVSQVGAQTGLLTAQELLRRTRKISLLQMQKPL